MYSVENSRKQILDIKLYRSKLLAKLATNKDFNLAHPNEVKAASSDNFTEVSKRINDDNKLFHKNRVERISKLGSRIN